jgi:hypothetical protein
MMSHDMMSFMSATFTYAERNKVSRRDLCLPEVDSSAIFRMRSRALRTVNHAGSWMSHVDMTALIFLYIVRKIRECVCLISNKPTSSWIILEVKRK